MTKNIPAVIILLMTWIFASSWGFTVHRTVNQLAVYELPGNLRTFFYANMDYIVRHSVRADLRRSDDSFEEARHFINLETYGDSAAWKMPLRWEDAIKLYSTDSLLKRGHVPYHVIAIKNLLTRAFKNLERDSVLFYAADLAHYIADAHVPLHTTVNYDGQLTGQKGLHSLWESMIPELYLDQYHLSSHRTARYVSFPEQAVWNAVRNAQRLTKDIFVQERNTSINFNSSAKYRTQLRRGVEVKNYSTQFARAYAKNLGASINKQLLDATSLIADLWFTSWVDAGKPDTRLLLNRPVTSSQKEQLKKEIKSFRKNTLVRDSLLLARKNAPPAVQPN